MSQLLVCMFLSILKNRAQTLFRLVFDAFYLDNPYLKATTTCNQAIDNLKLMQGYGSVAAAL